jgi:hypothetical protein
MQLRSVDYEWIAKKISIFLRKIIPQKASFAPPNSLAQAVDYQFGIMADAG